MFHTKTKLLTLAILAAMTIAACTGGSSSGSTGASLPGPVGNAQISVFESSPAGLQVANGAPAANGRDFGSQVVTAGATAALTIVVQNSGTDPLGLGAPSLAGTNPGDFVLNASSYTATVAPSGQTSFELSFDPTATGTRNATLSFTHTANNTGATFSFDLTGSGTSAPLTPVTPAISVTAPSAVTEGNTGNTPAVFSVSLSQPTSLTVSVAYQTQPGSTAPATSGTDYQSATGTLTFTSGQTSKTVTTQVIGDTTQENNETFDLVLSSPNNGTIATSTATCTITDDDAPSSSGGRVIMGYAENIWGAGGATAIQNFDYSAITHVIHGFVLPDANGNITEHANFNDFRTGGGWMPQNLPDAVHAAGKKIIMSIGGAAPATNATNFAAVAASASKRQTFINNVVNALNSWGYDGVDIDYEWPASTTQGQEFTTFMSELHTAVKANNANHLVMFGAGPGDKVGYKQWAQLGNYCDYCFFFGYDWHYGLTTPAPVGPIKNPGQTWTASSGPSFEYSVRGAVNYVLGQGFPAAKLVVGLPYYNDVNSGWSVGGRAAWLAMTPAQRQAAIDSNYMEALINGHYVTTPESIALKMSALLEVSSSVLRDASNNPVAVGGIGWWEWGYENPSHGELTAAVKSWLQAHP